MQDIVVFGASGFGREMIEELDQQNKLTQEYNILGFIDDDLQKQGQEINGFPVVGTSEFLLNTTKKIAVLVCIGETAMRRYIAEKLQTNKNLSFPNFFARNVLWNERVTEIGQGNIISFNTVLTVNVKLGDFNYINNHCSVAHDVCIGDFVTLSPATMLAGNVTVKNDVYIGIGSAIREGRTIGENTIIGMGSVVLDNIQDNSVAFGNPCKVKRTRQLEERVFKS